jgi:diphosphomevalonate decarboxylase
MIGSTSGPFHHSLSKRAPVEITVEATPNFALTKYWGKSHVTHPHTNAAVPATPSIGVTVAGISSHSRIKLGDPGQHDTVRINGKPLRPDEMRDAGLIISVLRSLTGFTESVEIESSNSFPTAAGAASSSSGMAAIAFGLSHLLKVPDTTLSISELARIGSVSAARATSGGFVLLPADGPLAAQQLFPPNHWVDLRIVLCVTSRDPKRDSSRSAMKLAQETSPIFPLWKKRAHRDTKELLAAITARDLDKLGTISERNTFFMHATTITSSPPVLFWNAGTMAVIQLIQTLRKAGVCAYCTMDAGPQVKVICDKSDLARVLEKLEETPLVIEAIPLTIGDGPRIITTTSPVIPVKHSHQQ